VVINADALNRHIRESIFDHFSPVTILELLKDNKQGGDKLKQLLDQRAAQRLRLDALVDDYACGLLGRAELARAKTRAQAELSHIKGEIDSLNTRRHQGELLTVKESLRQAWEANEGISRRRALIDTVVEPFDVFPGIRKPFVNVDGVTMRFDKDRVMITWRKADTLAA
jgi:hypothetical protein